MSTVIVRESPQHLSSLPPNDGAIDAVADSAVEIAQINADKEVAVAQIASDTVITQTALEIDAAQQRQEQWESDLVSGLEAENAALKAQVATLLLTQATPLLSEPIVTAELVEVETIQDPEQLETEPASNSESEEAESLETQTPPSKSESQGGGLAQRIIRLV